MLEVPPTIRLPRKEELPNNPEVFERLKDRENANIVQGFILKENTTHDLPFKYYAEVNIDNSRLWDLFIELSQNLPESVSFIYNEYEEDPSYGNYSNKTEIIKFLENYKVELTQDCFLEWGLITDETNLLEEVFIADSKYVKVWGNNEVEFRQSMAAFDLQEISTLNFIDEFPKVVEALTMHNNNAKPTYLLIQEFSDYFKS